MSERRNAIEATLLDPIEAADRRPGTFIVTGGELAGRADPDAIRSAETGSEEFALLAVGGDFQERAMMVADLIETPTSLADRAGLDDVEIAGRVGLQVEGELVEIPGDHEVEIEYLVGVALAVAVRITELPDAIAAGDIDLTVHDLEAERVIETGSEATPGDLLEFVIDAGGDEDVAMEGADHRAAIRKKIEGRREHLSLPGIGHREFHVVDDVRLTGLIRELAGRLDRLGPEGLGDLQQLGGHLGLEGLRQRYARREISDSDRADFLGAIHPGDSVTIELVDLGDAKRHDAGGIG